MNPVERYEALRYQRDKARDEMKRLRGLSNEGKGSYARMVIGNASVPDPLMRRICETLGEWADDERNVIADLEQQMADLFKPTRPEEVSETAPSVLGTR